MNRLEFALREDRALRMRAKRMVKQDIRNLKADITGEGSSRNIGERLLDRTREGAGDLKDAAIDYADDNRGQVSAGAALGIAAVVAWLFRDSLEGFADWLLHGEDLT
ncbi:hypothetical protein [Aurantiacibacter spongiae]|uniref:DUF3618 domain-containing protein n=1 Tax=Aurantiacibacter spongiae TaxID=2488860 RepID=A0A3N5CSE7_9SPHN|nr:hypothetical protein [Aurantiacibacter spongiae]RPF70230.1 hypothetical protein EG799_00235 [Aurantiacibacter spongiae]